MAQSLIQAEKYNVLVNWWRESCQSFSLFFLFKSSEQRREFLLKCSPDMPLEAAATRERKGEQVNATDLIVPELFLEGLDAGDGRCLILFITRRLASPDTGLENDLTLLRSLQQKGVMPTFSNGSLDSFRLPFVDPLDPTESIQSFHETISKETLEKANNYFSTGKIIHAEVFLTCSVRRNLLATFLLALKENYELETAEIEKETDAIPTETNQNSANSDNSNVGIC